MTKVGAALPNFGKTVDDSGQFGVLPGVFLDGPGGIFVGCGGHGWISGQLRGEYAWYLARTWAKRKALAAGMTSLVLGRGHYGELHGEYPDVRPDILIGLGAEGGHGAWVEPDSGYR